MAKNNPIQKRHAKLKSFLFFLLLATFFWVLTKFTNEYAAQVTSQIEYINIPPSRFLAEGNEKEVSFNLYTNGFNFLSYTLKKPTIKIDVSKYFEIEAQNVTLTSSQIAKEINLQFPSVNEVTAISMDNLTIQLSSIEVKKVPVFIPTQVTYKSGFQNIGKIQILPDSIEISGPLQRLKEIDSVITVPLELTNISQTIATTLAIEPLDEKELKINTDKVAVTLEVKEFTQQEFVFEVEVINTPESVSLQLIPQRIKMTFLIPVEAYGSISKEDFKIVCDYNNRNVENNFMTPQVVKQPSIVRQVVFDSKKIDYLVFKI